MGKKKGQGYRSELDDIPYGRTRKVSHKRISVPSPAKHEGRTFEAGETEICMVYSLSGSNVSSAEYIKSWEDIESLAKEKLKKIKPKQKKKK